MKYSVPLLYLLFVIGVPMQAYAAVGGLVTCTDGDSCGFCEFMEMAQKIENWVVGIAFLIAMILFMYAGYRITSARGDVTVVTEARKMIGNVAIGIFILILAWTIVDTLMKTLTGGDFGVWNQPDKCVVANPSGPAVGHGVNLKSDHKGPTPLSEDDAFVPRSAGPR